MVTTSSYLFVYTNYEIEQNILNIACGDFEKTCVCSQTLPDYVTQCL